MLLRKYNPALLSDAEIIDQFVARRNDLKIILKTVRDNIDASSNQHLMIIGSRGMGKTLLILRAAVEIRQDADLNKTWFPLVMAEESYMIGSAAEFWLETILRLAENQNDDKLREIHSLLLDESDDKVLYEKALQVLLDYADNLGKRLLVFVENFNMLFDEQMKDEDGWRLRETLIHEPRIMLIATAVGRFDQIDNINQPMFELFAVKVLKALSPLDSQHVWTLITGEDIGRQKIRPIEILTGGNPRLLVILSSFAASNSFRELMENLISLVDDHTDYLKSNTEMLPNLERKAFVALADIWSPATAKEVSRLTRLSVNQASTQLVRLEKRGAVAVQKTEGRRKFYQLSERLYNIYHQLRRRGGQSNRVKAVVKFMVEYYEERELKELVGSISKESLELEPQQRESHFMALAQILADHNDLVCSILPEVFNCPDSLPHLSLFQNASARDRAPLAPNLEVTDMETANDEIWRQAEFLSRAIKKNPGIFPYALEPYLIKTEDKDAFLHRVAEMVFDASLDSHDKSTRTYKDEETTLGAIAWNKLGNAFHDRKKYPEAESAYRKTIEIDNKYAPAWNGLGNLLYLLKKYSEAESAYRKAIEIDPDEISSWIMLGFSLIALKEYSESEMSFRKAIEIDPKNYFAWCGLGDSLNYLKDYTKAEVAFHKAIEIDPEQARIWYGLGFSLKKLKQYPEAESAFSKAINIDPELVLGIVNLGGLLYEQGRFTEALSLFRKAVKINPDVKELSILLGVVLYYSGKFGEAETCFRNLLKQYPDEAALNNSLGYLLLTKKELDKSKKLLTKAVELDSSRCLYYVNLGIVQYELGMKDDSLKYFKKALKLLSEKDPIAADYNSLALLCIKHKEIGFELQAEEWIKRALERYPNHPEYTFTYARILAAQFKWEPFLEQMKVFLDHHEFARHFILETTELFIRAAREGYAEASLELLSASPIANHVEPLVVALQKYLDMKTNAPLEIYEVAKDIVNEIKKSPLPS